MNYISEIQDEQWMNTLLSVNQDFLNSFKMYDDMVERGQVKIAKQESQVTNHVFYVYLFIICLVKINFYLNIYNTHTYIYIFFKRNHRIGNHIQILKELGLGLVHHPHMIHLQIQMR